MNISREAMHKEKWLISIVFCHFLFSLGGHRYRQGALYNHERLAVNARHTQHNIYCSVPAAYHVTAGIVQRMFYCASTVNQWAQHGLITEQALQVKPRSQRGNKMYVNV